MTIMSTFVSTCGFYGQNRPYLLAIPRGDMRNHNPRVGGSSPSSGIALFWRKAMQGNVAHCKQSNRAAGIGFRVSGLRVEVGGWIRLPRGRSPTQAVDRPDIHVHIPVHLSIRPEQVAERATTSGGPSFRDVHHAELRRLDKLRVIPAPGPRPGSRRRTRAVTVEPSTAGRRGEPRAHNSSRTNRTGYWTLDSRDVLSKADDHLDEHLCWLLDQLEPRAGQLRAVITSQQQLEAQCWCVISMHGANVDFELPPGTIARIAALGCSLRFDVYAPDRTEPDVIVIPESFA